MPLDKTFEPADLEQAIYARWENAGHFSPKGDGEPYCIMIPPPNVTGSLHMGHGFNNAVMDALIRFQRMKGRPTLWQPGTDHAGIATQMVVERRLEGEGKTRHDLGRDAFIEKIWEWKAESGGNITRQLRRLGSSLDWEHERFTMDDGLSESVREVFVRLHEEGLIYRGKRLVNWDPKLHTAVSDLEVVKEEEAGHMWHMRYPLTNGTGHLTVSTTRPETMLGDCAVAVNPEDERYKHLIGELVTLPLSGRKIPIVADEHADPEFGTGCVKITPAHDFDDYAVWQRHRDENAISEQIHGGLINILTIDAAIRDNEEEEGDLIPSAYVGLDRFAARKKIVADLDAQGLLDKVVDHRLPVPRGDRSGMVLEPYLTDQWFVKAGPLAKPAIEAVEDGRIRFIPDNWKNTYFDWMRNIQDWCISRQIWWGHRIPAWYDDEGNVYVGRNEAEVREKHSLSADYPLRQDNDVLDTWFSSALWPFSTQGWPQETPRLEQFYPGNVLVTGFDIIFFWVARMIMMGMKFMGDVPFKDVYIHGLIRDGHGQKMSKSKGNVLDPIDLIDGITLDELIAKRTSGLMQPQMAPKIEKLTRSEFPDGIKAYGTDALRFTFAALASTGRDINFDIARMEGYRNFCNKIWNATRFVEMNLEGDIAVSDSPALPERWIKSRMAHAMGEIRESFDGYRLDLAAKAMHEFTWHTYCDWYVELSKVGLSGDQHADTRHTLLSVLEAALRMLHPIMPFITETLWPTVAKPLGIEGDTIMLQPYPAAEDFKRDEAAEDEMDWLQNVILGVRRIRGEMDIAPGKPLPILLRGGNEEDHRRVTEHEHLLTRIARFESITWLGDSDEAPESATALVGELNILIPIAGLIDVEAECARLEKDIAKQEKLLKQLQGKLSNEKFVSKAPADVVEKERTKAAETESKVANLKEQLEKLSRL